MAVFSSNHILSILPHNEKKNGNQRVVSKYFAFFAFNMCTAIDRCKCEPKACENIQTSGISHQWIIEYIRWNERKIRQHECAIQHTTNTCRTKTATDYLAFSKFFFCPYRTICTAFTNHKLWTNKIHQVITTNKVRFTYLIRKYGET